MEKNKRSFVLLLLVGFLFSFSSAVMAAENYIAEVSANYSRMEIDTPSDFESRLCGVTGKIHFQKVNTEGHPLNEADFLERIGSVEVFLGGGDSDSDTSESEGLDFMAVANFRFPSSPVAFYLLLAKSSYETDYDPPFSSFDHDRDSDNYGAGVGWFIQDNLEVELNYLKSETDLGSPINETYESDIVAVSAKYVAKLGGEKALNLEGIAMLDRYDDPADDEKTGNSY